MKCLICNAELNTGDYGYLCSSCRQMTKCSITDIPKNGGVLSITRKTEIIEEDRLESRLRYWQHVLGLDHWNIVAKIKRRIDMGDENQGECNWEFIGRSAIVSLLSPLDWINSDFEQDMEKTLVHELLHCKFDEIGVPEWGDKFLHRLLNDMAVALVRVYREGGKGCV